MRILPFPISRGKENNVRDWTQQEIADFYRAHRLLVENGTSIGLDRGTTDVGEPWMVFFDVGSQDVFLHLARIDNVCHLICEPLNLKLSAPTVASLITRFEDAVKSYLSIRTERSRNVVIHPAARIILSISALFLLVKLDSGEAQAKETADKTVFGGDPVSRLGADKSTTALARAHHAFARVFESVEAPHSAALLAGIILAGELALSSSRQSSTVAHQETAIPTVDASDRAYTLLGTSGHDDEASGVLNTVTAAVTINPTELDEPAMTDAEASSSDGPVLILEHPVIRSTSYDFLSVKPPQPVATSFVDLAVLGVETVDVSETPPLLSSDSIKALNELIRMDADSFVEEGDVKLPIALPTNEITNISVANLDELNSKVGFFHQTSYNVSQMFQLVDYFKGVLGGFEFGYLGGKVLIEEIGLEVRSDQEIGLWTNVMADGSTFSVIGNVNLIDDVVTFFS